MILLRLTHGNGLPEPACCERNVDVQDYGAAGLGSVLPVSCYIMFHQHQGVRHKGGSNWAGSVKTTGSQTTPANAQQICSLDSKCVAWNNFGYYLLVKGSTAPTVAAAGISFFPYSGLCTYVKATALSSCPDKAGYVTKSDTNWIGSDMTDGSQTSPANAQEVCDLDDNCLAWNNFGYYIFAVDGTEATVEATGISFTPYSKLCTYVKEYAM